MSNSSPTIFIVEDETLIAMEIRDRLTRLGYTVLGIAARGEEALEQMTTCPPDVALMDVRLAGTMNGIETAARLRETTDIAVIFLTAYSDAQLIKQAGETEPYGYLVKPFEERELHATIQMALYRRRMERALREANERLEEQVRARTAELAASEQRFRDFAEVSTDWLWERDAQGLLTYVSETVNEAIGGDAQNLLGTMRAETFAQVGGHLDDLRSLEEPTARREPFRDVPQRRRDSAGRVRYHTFSGRPFYGESGEFLGYRGATRDRTEEMEARAALDEKTAILDAVLRAMPDGVRISDLEYRLVEANDRLYELFAVDKEQAIASGDPGWYMLLEMARRGEYGPGDPEELARARYALPASGQFHYERQLKHGRWIEARGYKIAGIGHFSLYRDISARKAAEEELRAREQDLAVTLESIGDAVLTTDLEGLVTRMNPVAERLTGWPAAEAMGRPIAEVFRIINEDTRFPAVIPVDEVLATGTIHELANHAALIARDGTEYSIADSAAPIRDAAGRTTGVVLVFRDETETRYRRRLVDHQRTMLAALSDVQRQFIGGQDPNAALNRLLDVLLAYTDSAFGLVGEVLHTPTGRPYLKTQALTDTSWDEQTRRRFALQAPAGLEFSDLETLYGAVITGSIPVIVNNPANDPRRAGLPPGHPPLTAFLGVPIHVGDEVVGMIGLANRLGGYDEQLVAELQPLLSTYGSMIVAQRNDRRRLAAETSLRELNADLDGELRRRSQAVIETERFTRATLDALAAQVAVLDERGVILTTNQAWREFTRQNGPGWEGICQGANYLAACERAAQLDPDDVCADALRQIARGIRDVIAERMTEFVLEHPCHRPSEERWYLSRVTRFPGKGMVGVVIAHEDITPVKLAQRQLEVSQRTFESLATASPVGIFRTDPDGSCLYVTQRWCDLTGLTSDEALGDGWARALHPEDRACVVHEWQAAASARMPFRCEYRFQRADGLVTWVLGQSIRITDGHGETTGFVGTITEITDQKQIETALRVLSTELVTLDGDAFFYQVVQRLAAILDSEIAFICRLDPAREGWLQTVAVIEDGRLLDNFSYPSDGAPCAEVLGGKVCVVASEVQRRYPIDHYLVEKQVEAYAAVPLMSQAGSLLGHLGIMRRQPLANPAREETILQLFGVSVAAAMERQRSARRFHALVEFSPDGLVMVDGHGRIALVNQEAERMFGWTREELAGKFVEMLVPTRDRPGHAALREGFLLSSSSRRMGADRTNLRAVRKDGTEFPVEISLSPIETDEGMMVVAAVRDITERRNLERQAHRQQRLEAIGRLAGGIAHDLNNALAPIVMTVDVLRESHPEEAELLEMLAASGDRASDMVRQLLSFARGAEGQRASIQSLDLIREVEKIVVSVFPKNIEVRLRLPRELPTVVGDATQLHQVLVNLSVNARDAMPAGGTLTLEAAVVTIDEMFASSLHEANAKPGRYVVLRVQDTGGGIPPEILDHIFDPFFTTKEPDRGTGLGLATVLGIVKGHGGFIQVDSQAGRGSAFEIYLPIADADDEHGNQATTAIVSSFHGQGETVLVVDDEAAVCRAAQIVLSHLGVTPMIAGSAVDALSHLARDGSQVRAIITDLHMPQMDGLAFVRAVRNMGLDVPVIVASGRLDEHVAAEFRSLGVGITLDKPFTQGRLADALEAALQGTANGD